MTMTRILRDKQIDQENTYDPDREDIPAVYKKGNTLNKSKTKMLDSRDKEETKDVNEPRGSLFAKLLNNVANKGESAKESKYALIFK